MAVDTLSAARDASIAPPLITGRNALIFIAALTVLRLVTAAWLPLAFDEAYYWLWSKNLALGYYDHPPLIAVAIRIGTLAFGDTEFGVRFVPFAVSLAASWAVWEAAETILPARAAGATACSLYNATLMVASQSMAATPDCLVLPAAAFLLLAQAKLAASRNGAWWLMAGAALGIAFLAKLTALFMAAGLGAWLALSRDGRQWLASRWTYVAAAIALLCLVPVIYWNAAHDWVSFRFQFGRTVSGGLSPAYTLEFLAGQAALASPFVLCAGGAALFKDVRSWLATKTLSIAGAQALPALVYFAFHSLHDRVQGNWPSFIYPALAVLAASALLGGDIASKQGTALKLSRRLALPAAVLILLVAYVQTFSGLLRSGHKDPIARMTAVGFAPIAGDIAAAAKHDADAGIVTTAYAPTGWLAFYLAPKLPVMEIGEDYRWLQAPTAQPKLLQAPLLYVTERPASELPRARSSFAHIRFIAALARARNGVTIDKFYVYAVSGFRGTSLPRIANAPLGAPASCRHAFVTCG
jgi:4-amino-4-deoxy-L-arabinose transferase-like glycosyltransferase